MKNILMLASEAVPFIKTGGLADVVGSLPKTIDKQYYDCRVMIPKYMCIPWEWRQKMEYVTHFYMNYLGQDRYVGVLKYDYAKFWMTSKGLFLRNINRSLSSPIYPDSLLEYHVGGYEESIASIEIFKAGLKMATYFNCSTYLPRASHIEPDREVPDDIHNFALSSKSVEDYIMKEFGCRYPITDARCIPQFVRSLYKRGLGYRYE